MHHLKRILFGIILQSSGSAFANEYVPKQDDFDQLINALVPILLIIFCLNQKERNFGKRKGY